MFKKFSALICSIELISLLQSLLEIDLRAAQLRLECKFNFIRGQ